MLSNCSWNAIQILTYQDTMDYPKKWKISLNCIKKRPENWNVSKKSIKENEENHLKKRMINLFLKINFKCRLPRKIARFFGSNSVTRRTKIGENAKLETFKCYILSNFKQLAKIEVWILSQPAKNGFFPRPVEKLTFCLQVKEPFLTFSVLSIPVKGMHFLVSCET